MLKLSKYLVIGVLAPVVLSAEPTRRDKMAAILRAEDRRTDEALAPLVRDADPGVRRRATLAAGRVGGASLALTVRDRLDDPVPEVRAMAAFALGLMGDAHMVPRLRAALGDRDSTTRARAAEALSRIGGPEEAAEIARMVLGAIPKNVAPLVIRGDDPGSPTDPWLELRMGLIALGRLGDVRSAESVLLEGGRPRFDWWAAAWLASRLKTAALDPVLVAAAESSDPMSRCFAASGLARPAEHPRALEVLMKLAEDRDERVASRALGALGHTGERRAVPVLEAALEHASPRLKESALASLVLLPGSFQDGAGRSLREKVVALVGHDDPAVRRAAIRLIAQWDPAELALILSGLGRDSVWSVRAAVAGGLAGAKDELSQGLLYGLLKDDDARVVASALPALGASLGQGATLVLGQHLTHPDLGVRAAAARELARLGAGPYGEDLARSYKTSISDEEPEARLSIVAALKAAAGSAAEETLREAARTDASRAVRSAAARALAARGAAAPPDTPEEARPPLDYFLAMSAYDPHPDVPVFTPRAFLHTRRGAIEIHLNTLEAPLACESFIAMARGGFFDDRPLHGATPGVAAFGGCPRGDGLGGPRRRLRREAGVRPFGRGAVGLDAVAPDAEGSRFFITLLPDPERDGYATLLGTVVGGMNVVEALRAHDVIERVEIWDGR